MSLTVAALEAQSRKIAVLHAYRHLYRTGLQTIRYSSPARHVLLWTLRKSFRNGTSKEFNPQRIVNTLEFLRLASSSTSTEHKIIKNLLHVRFWQQPQKLALGDTKFFDAQTGARSQMRSAAYRPFEMTLKMLNESLGLCLK
ncbi:DUF1763 superfamily domain-containing protein [Histoplasma capsulatum]|uniref:DUF1763 superfamily domain-containing protein n=1 Tax=Ajellomyces capsulatus TaxID=5037 RepID=A0A8A1M1P4_AJECA|nr:predicted protein [Histoplasma mississippiense (nom. inval.)]EDN04136.1 predicted protein [Histoplasma mississippiense (nom. inval.)]QSS59300.1 DUF1763 superfamily domain-containing protein [Histoplasma capsulatum]